MAKTVLLIDDDEVFQYSMKRACKKIVEITEVFTARNGAEALDLIRSILDDKLALPDYIFLDINMPVLDGFGFLAGYKRLQGDLGRRLTSVVIAMLTSSAHEKDRDRAMETGLVKNFIIKPASLADAVVMIEKCIQ